MMTERSGLAWGHTATEGSGGSPCLPGHGGRRVGRGLGFPRPASGLPTTPPLLTPGTAGPYPLCTLARVPHREGPAHFSCALFPALFLKPSKSSLALGLCTHSSHHPLFSCECSL